MKRWEISSISEKLAGQIFSKREIFSHNQGIEIIASEFPVILQGYTFFEMAVLKVNSSLINSAKHQKEE